MLGLLFECEENKINLKCMLPVYFPGPGLLPSLGYLVLIYVPVYNEERTSCFSRNRLLCQNFLISVLRDFLNAAWSLTSWKKMYSFLSVVLPLITLLSACPPEFKKSSLSTKKYYISHLYFDEHKTILPQSPLTGFSVFIFSFSK